MQLVNLHHHIVQRCLGKTPEELRKIKARAKFALAQNDVPDRQKEILRSVILEVDLALELKDALIKEVFNER